MYKRIVSIVLALALLCAGGAVAVAADDSPQELLPLTLRLETQMSTTFLMGNIDLDQDLSGEITDDIYAEVWVSTDGEHYTDRTNFSYWGDPGAKTDRICLVPDRWPLSDYLNETVDTIFIYLVVHFTKDDSVRKTETAVFTRQNMVQGEYFSMETDGITVDGCYANTVYQYSIRPAMLYGQMHLTVTTQADPSGYADLLPDCVPVQLDFHQKINNSDRFLLSKSAAYRVRWGPEPETLADGTLRYSAIALEAPTESLVLSVGSAHYQMTSEQYPDVLGAYPHLYCTVHPVAPGTQSGLLLSQNPRTKTISATLPLKPTGAKNIGFFTSVDGGESWESVGCIAMAEHPVDAIPNQESYTVEILSAQAAEGLQQQGGGFAVRLQILGGPLGNAAPAGTTTNIAVWPASYIYMPPSDPTKGHGGEGNLGNAGTDNSGTTDGVRPGTEPSGAAATEASPSVQPAASSTQQQEPEASAVPAAPSQASPATSPPPETGKQETESAPAAAAEAASDMPQISQSGAQAAGQAQGERPKNQVLGVIWLLVAAACAAGAAGLLSKPLHCIMKHFTE